VPARRLLPPAVCAAAALLLAGCGNERSLPPDVTTPGPRLGTNPGRFPAAGLTFDAPAGWTLRPGTAPLVATVTTGRASLAIYRYPRVEPLPEGRKELDGAAEALAGAAKQRDPSFAQIKRDRLRVDGRPAVVLRGTETVAGQPRTVRSTHVYAFGGEIVVDAFAPAADFKRVDAEVFRAVVRSLRIARPQG
jgi:hypothetical protein